MKLKKAYIRDSVNSSLINIIFKLISFENNDKILVKSMDGIGDILIRSKLADKIIEKYGKENVYFLMKNHYKILGDMLGYNVIGVSRKQEKNFFKRLKLMYYINKKYKPSKFLNIEFGNDSIIANISALEKIGVEDFNETVRKYNKYYTKSFIFSDNNEKILEKVREIGENILDIRLKKEDITPDLRNRFEISEENIVIAVGSTARNRVCSPLRMKEYIKVLNEKFPEDKIILVGNGDLQLKYAEQLIKLLPEIRLVNLVSKTTLKEVFNVVSKAKLFVGFESGLYNFCFTLRKRGIGLFKNVNVPFAHNVSWIKIIGPEKEKIDNFKDEEYPDEQINNISIDKFRKAVEELK